MKKKVKKFMKNFFLKLGLSSAILLSLFSLGTASAHTWTAHGSASISGAQAKFGAGSVVFGATDYVDTPNATDLNPGSSDFTLEYWIYPTSNGTNGQGGPTGQSGSNDLAYSVASYGGASPACYFAYSVTGTAWLYADKPANISINNWHSCALVRSGSNFYGFIDGTKYTLTSSGSAIYNPALPFTLGAQYNGYTSGIIGYIDEMRLSNVARYTADYTPNATAFTPDANTVVLIHFDTDFAEDVFSGGGGGTSSPATTTQATSTPSLIDIPALTIFLGIVLYLMGIISIWFIFFFKW